MTLDKMWKLDFKVGPTVARSALVNRLMPCTWPSSGTLEVWDYDYEDLAFTDLACVVNRKLFLITEVLSSNWCKYLRNNCTV